MRATFFYLLFIGYTAHAAMVLPPESIETEQGRKDFIRQILHEMPILPGSGYSSEQISNFVTKMNALLYRSGLAKDSQFQAWAEARPDPKTYSFYSFHEETKDIYTLSPEYLSLVAVFVRKELEPTYTRNKKEFAIYLAARIVELAEATTNKQSNAISAGLGSIFDQNVRREILTQKNIFARADSLSAALQNIDEKNLRAQFHSERFGIPRDELDIESAIRLLDSSVAQELELIHLLSALEVLERRGSLSPEDFSPEFLQWFTSDWKREFVTFQDLNETTRTAIARVRAIARNSFTRIDSRAIRLVRDSEIIVREVAPHLAVFRSCSGGDCSTKYSWAYPFSPKERNFYIYSPDNLFEEIGYISANILQIKGKDTLFIRDMTGKELSPEHIDLIIKGFAQVLLDFGVTQIAFAVPQFHQAENHFPHLYIRIESMIKGLPTHPTVFVDNDIRKKYLDGAVDDSHYDSPERHSLASLFVEEKLNPDSPPVRAERLSDTFVEDSRSKSSNGEELLRRLEFALTANNPAPLLGTAYEFAQWSVVYGTWMNSYRLRLDTYYENVALELKKIGFQFTPAIQRKFPNLFFAGILAAPDALSHPNEEIRNRNLDVVLQKFLRLQDSTTLERLGPAKYELFKYPPFLKAARQMVKRFRPVDRAKISHLWLQGFHFENMDLPKAVFEHIAKTVAVYSPDQVGKMVALAYDHDYRGVFASRHIGYHILQYLDNMRTRATISNTSNFGSEEERKVALFLATGPLENLSGLGHLYFEVRSRALRETRPFFRLALTIAYLREGKPTTEVQIAKFERILVEGLDSPETPEELHSLTGKVLEDLRKYACEKAIANEKKKANKAAKSAKAG